MARKTFYYMARKIFYITVAVRDQFKKIHQLCNKYSFELFKLIRNI